MITQTGADISRIAEIIIFTKRVIGRRTYRLAYRNDPVSFGTMQVLPLAEEYKKRPERLNDTWVYDVMILLKDGSRGR